MSKCQFIHVDAWARKGPHAKNSARRKACMGEILAELIRDPHSSPHIVDPQPPEILYGPAPPAVWEQACDLAERAVDRAGRKLKSTALVILVGVATYPVARSAVETDPKEWATFIRWRQKSISWLEREFGACLKLVVAHNDEAHPHIHFAALPVLGDDRQLRIGDVHPGHRAEQKCREAGGSRRDQKQAHQRAMAELQDRYYEDVVIEFGFARFGPKRQRLTRDEWKAQTKQLRALAGARDKLASDRQRIAAKAAHLVAERAAEAQERAAAQVAAVEAGAARKLEELKRHAVTHLRRLATDNRAMRAELDRRSALVIEQSEKIAELEALLAEQGLSASLRT